MGGSIRKETGAVHADGVTVPYVSVWRDRGPTAVVTGGVHGDELTGVFAIHELEKYFLANLKRGRVILVPSVNPLGMAARTRTIGPEAPDLNRMFPGDSTGLSAERFAATVFDFLVAAAPSVAIDLHADAGRSVPYAIVDRAILVDPARRPGLEATLRQLAGGSGLSVLHDYPSDQYRRFALDRSLAGAMVNRAGIPAVTIEAGPRRFVDPSAVAATALATRGILAELDLCDPVPSHPSRMLGAWRRATHLRADADGLLVPEIEPGRLFTRGQRIGSVIALDGELEAKIIADGTGFVVAWVDGGWVTNGQSVATLAIPEGEG